MVNAPYVLNEKINSSFNRRRIVNPERSTYLENNLNSSSKYIIN